MARNSYHIFTLRKKMFYCIAMKFIALGNNIFFSVYLFRVFNWLIKVPLFHSGKVPICLSLLLIINLFSGWQITDSEKVYTHNVKEANALVTLVCNPVPCCDKTNWLEVTKCMYTLEVREENMLIFGVSLP